MLFDTRAYFTHRVPSKDEERLEKEKEGCREEENTEKRCGRGGQQMREITGEQEAVASLKKGEGRTIIKAGENNKRRSEVIFIEKRREKTREKSRVKKKRKE